MLMPLQGLRTALKLVAACCCDVDTVWAYPTFLYSNSGLRLDESLFCYFGSRYTKAYFAILDTGVARPSSYS
jgi:hypothetical protein